MVAPPLLADANPLAVPAAADRFRLSETERVMLRTVFGDSLDLARVQLTPNVVEADAPSRTAGDLIVFGTRFKSLDASVRVSRDFQQTLVHEAVHVWQYQHEGASYATRSLTSQGEAVVRTGHRHAAYSYALGSAATFGDLGVEPQAKLVEEWFALTKFDSEPTRCSDFPTLGRDGFIKLAAALIARDLRGRGPPPAKTLAEGDSAASAWAVRLSTAFSWRRTGTQTAPGKGELLGLSSVSAGYYVEEGLLIGLGPVAALRSSPTVTETVVGAGISGEYQLPVSPHLSGYVQIGGGYVAGSGASTESGRRVEFVRNSPFFGIAIGLLTPVGERTRMRVGFAHMRRVGTQSSQGAADTEFQADVLAADLGAEWGL